MTSTVDELLKLLEEAPEKESSLSPIVDQTKIDDFVGLYKITAGLDRIPNFVIWYTYKKVYGGDLSKIEFSRQFKKLFGHQQRRTGKQRSYLLDGSSFDLSREGLIEAEFFKEK